MRARELLALAVFTFAIFIGVAMVLTASQGRGVDDSTAYAIFAGVFAAVAASIGVAVTWPWKKKEDHTKADEEKE